MPSVNEMRLIERLERYTDKDTHAPCWVWTGRTTTVSNSKGMTYPVVYDADKGQAVSVRNAWMSLDTGEKQTKGTRHTTTCGNNYCVNPDHMKPIVKPERRLLTDPEYEYIREAFYYKGLSMREIAFRIKRPYYKVRQIIKAYEKSGELGRYNEIYREVPTGRHLARIREDAFMTRKEIGALIGVSAATWRRFENSTRFIPKHHWETIRKHFGLPEWVYEGLD